MYFFCIFIGENKLTYLDVRVDSESASVKFRKIISFRIISKTVVNREGKSFARTELRHRHLP